MKRTAISGNAFDTGKIPYEKIKYVYSVKGRIIVNFDDNTKIEQRGSIKKLWKNEFSFRQDFGQPNKSYIVNMAYVDKFMGIKILMEDDMVIEVHPKYFEEFRKRTTDFLFPDTKSW